MKKTLIALMAMAGAAFGADYTTETIWTLNFGTAYEGGCQWVGSPEKTGTVWDSAKTAVEGGSQSNANQRIHMAGGVYGSWDEDFEFTMSLTLGETISASNNWPVFAEIAGNGTSLRFGPYTAKDNTVALDGVNLTKDDSKNNLVPVTAGGTYTITLTKIGNEVTVSVNGVASGYGVLADTVTGNITDIALGGNTGNQYRINEVVHSISWSKVTPTPAVPEPTTATLSLLALAGLAARRRRK